jgi:hypothetical protein
MSICTLGGMHIPDLHDLLGENGRDYPAGFRKYPGMLS